MSLKGRIVLALGGNALGDSPSEQLELVKNTAKTIVDLSCEGYEVIIGHGNGPQVGMINLGLTYASENLNNVPYVDFPECGAMSQGYIGYHLQQSVYNELKLRNIDKKVVSLVTQVLVSEDDPAFKNPTKPIGSFLTKEEADAISKEKGYTFVEDSGRGYRRVIASPQPKEIIELDIIDNSVSNGNITICCGGGGVPVIEKNNSLSGVCAVIDKDKTCAKLACDLKADVFVILTAVEKVCINFNKPNQQELSSLTIDEANKYINEGQFGKGSMLPKIEACLEFVKNSPNSTALITSLEKAKEALNNKTGTFIKK